MTKGHETAAGRLLTGAEYYASEVGWHVLPCWGIVGGKCMCGESHPNPKDNGKHPHGRLVPKGATEATTDVEQIRRWWTADPDANIGVRCRESGFFVVDIDPRNDGHTSFDKLEAAAAGAIPHTVTALTGEYSTRGGPRQGQHLFFKCDARERFKGDLKRDGFPGIDVKHNGYVLIDPSRHASGVVYEWAEGKAPWEISMAEAPEELLALLRRKGLAETTEWGWVSSLEWKGEKLDLDSLLEDGLEEGERAVKLYAMACALANKFGVDGSGAMAVENTMLRFNHDKVSPPLEVDGAQGLLPHVRRAIEFVRDHPKTELMMPGLEEWRSTIAAVEKGEVTIGSAPVARPRTLESAAEWIAPQAVVLPETLPPNVDAVAEEAGGVLGGRSLSDLGNGRRIIDYSGQILRFTEGLGWHVWNGNFWYPDRAGLQISEISKTLPTWIASEVVRAEGDQATQIVQWANKSKAIAARRNAVADAMSDTRIQVAVTQWDYHDEWLGVKNGVINLRTGELMTSRQDQYITKQANVAYTPGMRSKRWENFLEFATGGDKELERWLQKAAGYTLTGRRDHDVLFLVYGPPGSGKSTFLEALGHMLGDYLLVLPSAVLVDQGFGSAGSDEYYWAQLLGKRMVSISELPEARKTKEDAIKKLTGDKTVQGRHPHERPFNFESKAKMWIGTNHRPQVEDQAMWRRIRAIPFKSVPEKPDPDLKPFLMDPEGGLPAALSWAVDGAVSLLGSGERDALGWCRAVKDATDEYKASEDRLGMFLDEETKPNAGAAVPVRELYMVYRFWADGRGERPMTTIAFTRKLEEKGLAIDGRGASARLMDRVLKPRAVVSSTPSWETLTTIGGA